MQYIILLNNILKDHLLKLPVKEKKRLKEKIEFLESGLWDTGLKVKKLKGIKGKVVFEARIDKGNRLLFTLGRHEDKTTVYVWGITAHDDIGKNARMIMPSNAPFLNFVPDRAEDYEELIIDNLSDEYYSQENIEEVTGDDYGPQKWHILNDVQWERFFTHQDPNDLDFEMFLYLTQLQNTILHRRPPILLSGTAGSGKTTISVYYLFRDDLTQSKKLFLTYNTYLKKFSEKTYNGLIKSSVHEGMIRAPDFYVFKDLLLEIANKDTIVFEPINEVGFTRFKHIFYDHKHYRKYDAELVWQEIRSIIKGAKPQISTITFNKIYHKLLKNQVSEKDLKILKEYLIELKHFDFFGKIKHIVEKKIRQDNYDLFVDDLDREMDFNYKEIITILTDVLQIVKKKAADFSAPLLTYDEYLMMGKKRAPLFYYDREEIYGIAEFYRQKLAEQNLWDEIDLCKYAINKLESSAEPLSYDFVICDEIQDFTDVQLYFIMAIVNDIGNVVFAGDPRQIINPSSFRWEEVKDKFFERGRSVPDVYNMRLNFRSVGNIVRLGNAILDIKQRFLGLSADELKEEWKFNGRTPVVFHELDEQVMIEGLKHIGANQIILVRNEQEKRELKRHIASELIFTISEAKGLEFETVFIWKFINEERYFQLWETIKNGEAVDTALLPHIKHELNLFYVAITRARDTLIFYDGYDYSTLWDIESLDEHIYLTDDRVMLNDIWNRISGSKDWEKQGDYFFDREYYRAASECYKNAGNEKKYLIAEAFVLADQGDYLQAADIFAEYGYKTDAALNYQRAKEYEKAYALWKELDNADKMLICRIYLYEQKGKYTKAGNEWYKLGKIEDAIRNWQKGSNFLLIGDHYFEVAEYMKAASFYKKAKLWEKEALCFEKVKRYREAADIFYQCARYDKAAALYEKSGIEDALLKCYIKLDDYYRTALLYEERNNGDAAVKYFKKYIAEAPERALQLREEAEKMLDEDARDMHVLSRYAAIGDNECAGDILAANKIYKKALLYYLKTNATVKIADCYLKLDMYYEYATTIEDTDLPDRFEISRKYFEKAIYRNGELDDKIVERLIKESLGFNNNNQREKSSSRINALKADDNIRDYLTKLESHDSHLLNYIMDPDAEGMWELVRTERLSMFSNISLKFIATWLSKHITHDEHLVVFRWFLNAFKTAITGGVAEERLKILKLAINNQFHSFYMISDEYRRLFCEYFDLIVFLQSYFCIIYIIRIIKQEEHPDEFDRQFIQQLKKAGTKSDCLELKACYYIYCDHEDLDDLLAQITINKNNASLFFNNKSSCSRVYDYFIEHDMIDNAVVSVALHKDMGEAVEMFEKSGILRKAGASYIKTEMYNEAIACYERDGDTHKLAYIYERMGNYDKALTLWNELGHTRNRQRLEKKIARSKDT